ncbi:PPOX class F420-dependent oxidoreductase [Nocardioides litoris]|uniref:PPOX class F420-dependent oxidoreductase n=1 Tax=Nocardioides litoris TaxID=1926648 RepID=UPI00112101B3|nr:PPOX class F420-dependent oxidoreductase [Nocardioides litoris]
MTDDLVRAALDHATDQHRAVLVTRRRDGSLQSSPITVTTSPRETLWISARAGSAKARNLARDPRATLCLVSDAWYAPWLHVDGTTVVHRVPEAVDLLVEYYRRASGEHEDWDDFRRSVVEEDRVLLEVTPERVSAPVAPS